MFSAELNVDYVQDYVFCCKKTGMFCCSNIEACVFSCYDYVHENITMFCYTWFNGKINDLVFNANHIAANVTPMQVKA